MLGLKIESTQRKMCEFEWDAREKGKRERRCVTDSGKRDNINVNMHIIFSVVPFISYQFYTKADKNSSK